MALSLDNKMGNDFVVDCLVESSGKVKLGSSYNNDKKSNELVNVEDAITNEQTMYSNGIVQCKWKMLNAFTVKDIQYDLMDKQYTILLAEGELENDDGFKAYHDLRTLSSQPVNLALVGSVREGSTSYLIQVHGNYHTNSTWLDIMVILNSFLGSLMVIAWLGSVSIAIIFARYFKDAWESKLVCGVKIWFAVSPFH